jgi:hypothetical protein
MARTGRPQIDINWKLLNGLCSVFCTQEEISSIMEVSVDTLERVCKREKRLTFAEYYKKASANGKASLRRSQYKAAVETENPTMLIWMGKQFLNQTDKQEMEHKGSVEIKTIFQELADMQQANGKDNEPPSSINT